MRASSVASSTQCSVLATVKNASAPAKIGAIVESAATYMKRFALNTAKASDPAANA
jgi:hypothetical protein